MSEPNPFLAQGSTDNPFLEKPGGQPQAPAAPKSANWQDNLKEYAFPNGTTSVQRPDGAVYIKPANDPRFKNQEGWKVFDPKTGVWTPATDVDASAMGTLARNGLGVEGVKSWGRNMFEGLKRPIEGGGGLVADVGHLLGVVDTPTYLEGIRANEERERYRQALKNNSGFGAGFTQLTGEALPVVAATMAMPTAAPVYLAEGATAATVPTASAPMAARVLDFGRRAGMNSLTAAGTTYVTTPGSQDERLKAAEIAAVTAPTVQLGVEKGLVPLAKKLFVPRVNATPNNVPLAEGVPVPAPSPAVPGAAPNPSLVQDITIAPNLPGRLVIPKSDAPLNPRYQELLDLFDEHGVLARPGDITGNPSLRRTEDELLRLTPEMQQLVTLQSRQTMGATQRQAEALRQVMVNQGFESMDQLTAAAAAGGKRGTEAKKLLAAIDTSGQDWKLILKNSGNLNLFKGKLRADSAYDAFEQEAAKFGEVPLVNTVRSLEDAQAKLSASGLPDETTVSFVKTLRRNLLGEVDQAVPVAGQQAVGGGPAGTVSLPPQSKADTTFAGLRDLRSAIGDRISDYYTGKNSLIGKRGVNFLEGIKSAIEADMEAFSNANGPQLAEKWRNADRIYKTEVAPFKDKALALALSNESPEKLVQLFLNKGDAYTKTRLFKTLDPKGQAALRAGILDEGLAAGTNVERGVEGVPFSPAKAATWFETHLEAIQAAFPGLEGAQLKGLMRVLRNADRAGSAGANPMTGQVLQKDLQALQSVKQQALGKLERRALLKYYTTPEGRRALLQASEMKDGSPELQGLMNRMNDRMTTLTGAESAAVTRPESN